MYVITIPKATTKLLLIQSNVGPMISMLSRTLVTTANINNIPASSNKFVIMFATVFI